MCWKVFCFLGGMAVAVEAVQVAVLGDAQCRVHECVFWFGIIYIWGESRVCF